MERRPITRIRAEWHEDPSVDILGVETSRWWRRCHDGELSVMVGENPHGWHLSISHRGNNGKYIRYPSWDEIAHARDCFTPPDVAFVMQLPTADEYVAVHETCFHIHEYPPRGEHHE